jgi:hypothetical protein
VSLIRYLLGLARQIVGFTFASRRPGLMLIVVVGLLVAGVTIAVQFAAPVVIYPFL